VKQKKTELKSDREVRQKLAETGLRLTPHRLQIARQVLKRDNHFTADEIILWASKLKNKLSRATVYNILNEFVAVGLLRSFYSSGQEKLIFDSNTKQHFHFLDLKTNEVFDVDPAQVKFDSRGLVGFKVEEAEVLFKGHRLSNV
jgi:Fur family transcriptional regulator, iron response regulator